jgi:hypothetical protein
MLAPILMPSKTSSTRPPAAAAAAATAASGVKATRYVQVCALQSDALRKFFS